MKPRLSMPIQDYHFGSITIDGRTCHHDVEVRWDGEVLLWQRKYSHIIAEEDIKRALKQKPELIIIGTGESGVAEVTEDAQREIKEQTRQPIIEITGKAVKTFNRELEESKGQGKKVIGLFHLTC